MTHTTTIDTADFLRLIHGDRPIHFRALKKGCARNFCGHLNDLEIELSALNKDGHGIYFVVNRGGTRKVQINAITGFFADFDDLSKAEAMTVLAGTALPPTIIVESKRSIHAYWILAEPYQGDNRLDLFEEMQQGLNARLGSDPRVKTAERVMALPGFWHVKDPSDPFLVKVIDVSGVLYEILDFQGFRREGRRLREEDSMNPRTDHAKRVKGGDNKCKE